MIYWGNPFLSSIWNGSSDPLRDRITYHKDGGIQPREKQGEDHQVARHDRRAKGAGTNQISSLPAIASSELPKESMRKGIQSRRFSLKKGAPKHQRP